jgi:hypothetical protein
VIKAIRSFFLNCLDLLGVKSSLVVVCYSISHLIGAYMTIELSWL